MAADRTGLTVSFTSDLVDTEDFFGGDVLTFRGSDDVGATAKSNALDTASTLAITSTQASSALVVAVGDLEGNSGASRVWRTVNGVVPSAANSYEQIYVLDLGNSTYYGAYYPDAGDISAKTVGITNPTTPDYSIIAVEVKGTTDAGTSGPPTGVGKKVIIMGVRVIIMGSRVLFP